MAQTFDGPTTIKRSGSEHRRAVTSLALLERARAWEWVKAPPAWGGTGGANTAPEGGYILSSLRVSVPQNWGNRRGRKDY